MFHAASPTGVGGWVMSGSECSSFACLSPDCGCAYMLKNGYNWGRMHLQQWGCCPRMCKPINVIARNPKENAMPMKPGFHGSVYSLCPAKRSLQCCYGYLPGVISTPSWRARSTGCRRQTKLLPITGSEWAKIHGVQCRRGQGPMLRPVGKCWAEHFETGLQNSDGVKMQ